MTNERDIHFQGFAKLLLAELAEDEYDISPTNDFLVEIIAQRAYDLVYHALFCNGPEAWYRPGLDYPNPTIKYARKVIEHTNEIPDLTQWPPS